MRGAVERRKHSVEHRDEGRRGDSELLRRQQQATGRIAPRVRLLGWLRCADPLVCRRGTSKREVLISITKVEAVDGREGKRLIELAGVVESAHHTTDHPTLWDGNVYRATSFYTCFVVQLGCTTLCKAVVDIFARSKSRWSIRVVSRVLKQSHTQRSRFTPRPTSRHRLMQLWTQPSACRVGRSTCPWSPAEHQVQRVTTNPYPCPTETPARRRH